MTLPDSLIGRALDPPVWINWLHKEMLWRIRLGAVEYQVAPPLLVEVPCRLDMDPTRHGWLMFDVPVQVVYDEVGRTVLRSA
jgi:hypothetical protein